MHFDRLEMVWIPDGGTAAAALQTGEIDWVEYPLPDLVPVLAKDSKITTQVYDPNGFLGFLRFNHLHAPFNDVRVRRAIRDVMVQPDYMAAVALPGDWQECHAVFPCGLPGVKEFTPAPRGEAAMERARAALREAGYKRETVVLVNPSDFPAVTQQGRVTADLMRRLGVTIEAGRERLGDHHRPPRQQGAAEPGRLEPAQHQLPGGGHRQPRGQPDHPRAWRSAPGSAGRATRPPRPRSRPGSTPPTARPRRARWRRCRMRPGRACPSPRPACSACARPSGAT
ncbi:ABC transporter substrate-binding protein [Dankookia sp. P2]|uniref:ABC transporter substrate-binding protein n=1 Tax=Dankookia sp. P2 TaxID=3423955 RepID=UPI003D67803D